ncbi:MAG: hypothetical protein HY862_09195 [Chloroflexi bacterium]|nr:hypothetical protein [Chloroflexota bacterium]
MSEPMDGMRNCVIVEWLFERRVVTVRIESTMPDVIDAWYETSLEVIQNWPEDKPYLFLGNFTNLGLTPYSRQCAEKLALAIPKDMSGRVAVVISRGILGYGLRMFGINRLKALIPNLPVEFFFEETKALAWLEELL